jgi:predicted DNA-binding protein with PD1-like motif
MESLPLRIPPGRDLRRTLEEALAATQAPAAFVVAGIGSLSEAHIRFANRDVPTVLSGDYEILTLGGSLSPDGAHLHISIADSQGRVFGGHLSSGSIVRTTAEVLVLLTPEWSLSRELDPATGFKELVVRRQPSAAPGTQVP